MTPRKNPVGQVRPTGVWKLEWPPSWPSLHLSGIYGSLKVGIGWGAEGPKAGFFPFYVSLAVIIACAVNLAKIFATADEGDIFASWNQLRLVLAVVVPTAIYVAAIPYLGIYVASAILIMAFMKWLGRYAWIYAIGVGAIVPFSDFPDVRVVVSRAPAEGTARENFRLLSLGCAGAVLRPAQGRRKMLEDIGNLIHGFAVVVQPFNLLLMVVGIVLGVIVGVLPGLGGANGVAILLPLTFSMSPTSAIIMLSCIYWGALFGGAITSILFNIPGEPWSVATTFDGYPMAQQGRAGEALTAAFTSSFVGALFRGHHDHAWSRRWWRASRYASDRQRFSRSTSWPSAASWVSARSRHSRRWHR